MKATQNAAIYRPDLGQAVMEFYETEVTDFIGLEVMPLFPTAAQAGSFPVIPKEAMLKLYDTSRAPRGAYKRDDFEYERGKYSTSEQGWEEPVDDVEATVARATALGGKVLVPAMEVTGVGRMAVIQDPQGAALSVMQYGGA